MDRFPTFVRLAAFVALLTTAFVAFGNPTTIGNGGDPLAQRFRDGKLQALRMLQAMVTEGDGEARKWMRAHREAMIADLEKTELELVDTLPFAACPAQTCACTQRQPQAKVLLSIERCSSAVPSVSTAGRLLVHEAVHHFGVANEGFADDVAAAVYQCNLTGAKPVKRVSIKGENWPGNLFDPGGADFDDYKLELVGDLAVNDLQLYASRAQDVMVGYGEGTPGITTQTVVVRVIGCDDQIVQSYEVSKEPVTRVPVRQGDRIQVHTAARTVSETRHYEVDFAPGNFLGLTAFRVTFE